jgi:hypothetical protein
MSEDTETHDAEKLAEVEADRSRTKAEQRERFKANLRESIGKIAGDRTTDGGRACIEAAMHLVDLGDLTEARQWVSLSFAADKTLADVKLHKALKKIEGKGKSADAFKRARKGSNLKVV